MTHIRCLYCDTPVYESLLVARKKHVVQVTFCKHATE